MLQTGMFWIISGATTTLSSCFPGGIRMERFLVGYEPPEKKSKKKTEEEKLAAARVYDKEKRERRIVPSWSKDFPWIITDGKQVFCRPCRSVYGPLALAKKTALPELYRRYSTGPFISGCKNLKRATLSTHQDSSGHKQAVAHNQQHESKPGSSEAEKCLQILNKSAFERLGMLFRNAHAIAKHCRSFKDFVWMATLDEKKGLAVGSTYRNDKQCRSFVGAIAAVEEKKIHEQLAQAKFISILSDGSVDVSVSENEIVYMMYAIEGKVQVFFAGINPVPKADAEGVFKAIQSAITVPNIPEKELYQKVVGYGCDGASVNTGQLNGVITKFRSTMSPSIILVHCMAHRLELAYKDSLKGIKLYDKLSTMLSELYSFYHKSSLQTNNLRLTFEALNLNMVTPLRVGGTRWMSHLHAALDNVWRAYPALTTHLDQVAIDSRNKLQGKAKGILKLLRCRSVVVFGHLMQDILTPLSKLSQELQRKDAGLYHAHSQLRVAVNTVKKYSEKNGSNLNKVINLNEYKGQQLTGDLVQFENSRNKVVAAVEKCVGSRFKDVDEGILKATRLADINSWPLQSVDDFGDDYVSTLQTHFDSPLRKNGVDVDILLAEWTSLKSVLYEQENHLANLDWVQINSRYKKSHPNILSLVDLCLSLPASSAECERGFSHMKLIKTEYRNRMKTKTLAQLIRIHLHSAEIEDFEPEPAIHIWNQTAVKSRRPHFKEYKSLDSTLKHVQGDSNTDLVEVEGDQPEDGPAGAVGQNDVMKDDENDAEHSDYSSDFSSSGADSDTDSRLNLDELSD